MPFSEPLCQGTFLIHKFHLKNPEDLDILIEVPQNEAVRLNASIKRSLSYKKNTVSMSFISKYILEWDKDHMLAKSGSSVQNQKRNKCEL